MLLLVAFVAVFSFFFYHFYWKRRNLPPGPFPLPFIGTLHYLIGQSTGEELMLGWRKKYGKVYTIWQGRQPVVLVTEYQAINDVFVKDADNYVNRGVEEDFLVEIQEELGMKSSGKGGIFFADDGLWRENRRFALHVLRNMGLGKGIMEERIMEEVQTLCTRIDQKSQEHSEFQINPLIDLSVGSIINCLMFGYRYTDDKLPEFYDLSKRARSFMQVSADPFVLIIQSSGYINFFKRLPWMREKYRNVIKASRYLLDFFKTRVSEYKKEMNDTDAIAEPTDYTQAFLQEQQRRKLNNDNAQYFTDDQLILMLFDLWVAGQETTANTLEWCVAYLIHNPDVQEQVHKELDQVVGSDRLITTADKSDLPYVSALLSETLRIANLVPLNIPRRVAKDTTIEGYLLKKDTWVVPQISLVMYDENVYKNPRKFDPSRFLDSNGRLLRSDELVPFSIGKRNCLGEGLARMELFLFLANILNQYKFLPAQKMPDLTRYMGITVRPRDFDCRIEKRHQS
ncbi:Cytochrome P450-33C9 [Aphelenchoides bicaudatus]|nr:Cytochrome P450-33C9 [Aphelenchoides bicaudatus]